MHVSKIYLEHCATNLVLVLAEEDTLTAASRRKWNSNCFGSTAIICLPGEENSFPNRKAAIVFMEEKNSTFKFYHVFGKGKSLVEITMQSIDLSQILGTLEL